MTLTPLPAPLGPVLDTTIAPSDARKVEQLKPDLLLTQQHHMCPGCGEPLALRLFLEAIEELGLATRSIAVVGASSLIGAAVIEHDGRATIHALRDALAASGYAVRVADEDPRRLPAV